MSNRIKYRNEIDGLRALAVLAVLIFHFFPGTLPNGFLGVDLFFVISGFLISLYILEQNNKNKFSFKNFYIRRIKRILPVTITVLIVTLIASYLILIEQDFDKFLKSVTSTLTFTANIFFWGDGGYFGSNDALKPLLHMWSLGVEEQFYLFFPLIFLFILKYFKSFSSQALILFSIIFLSFFGNYILIKANIFNPAFFLTPFRIWQFGIGSLSALIFANFAPQHNKYTLVISLLMIIAGMLLSFDQITQSLLVTMGAAFFLLGLYIRVALIDLTFFSKLSSKIGLISFSLYLWHWPILVFLKYIYIEKLTSTHSLFALILTFALSLISYQYIEKPFRNKFNTKLVLSLVLGFTLFLIILTIFLQHPSLSKKTTSSSIASASQTNFRCEILNYSTYKKSRACIINKNLKKTYSTAIIGNSHAQMYIPAIKKVLKKKNEKGLLIPLNSCLPTIDLNLSANCVVLAKSNYRAYINDKNIKTVIIGLTWDSTNLVDKDGKIFGDPRRTLLQKSLINLIEKIQNSGKRVYLIAPIETPNNDLPSILSRKVKFLNYNNSQIETSLRRSRVNFDNNHESTIKFFSSRLQSNFIQPSKILCDEKYCYFGNSISKDLYFADSSHLSMQGIKVITSLFNQIKFN